MTRPRALRVEASTAGAYLLRSPIWALVKPGILSPRMGRGPLLHCRFCLSCSEQKAFPGFAPRNLGSDLHLFPQGDPCHSAQLLAPYILFFKLSELLMIRGCPTLTWSGTILEDTSLLGGVMIIRET